MTLLKENCLGNSFISTTTLHHRRIAWAISLYQLADSKPKRCLGRSLVSRHLGLGLRSSISTTGAHTCGSDTDCKQSCAVVVASPLVGYCLPLGGRRCYCTDYCIYETANRWTYRADATGVQRVAAPTFVSDSLREVLSLGVDTGAACGFIFHRHLGQSSIGRHFTGLCGGRLPVAELDGLLLASLR